MKYLINLIERWKATRIDRKPLNTVKNPLLRTRDYDYEGVSFGK